MRQFSDSAIVAFLNDRIFRAYGEFSNPKWNNIGAMAEYFIEISKSAKVNVRENFLVDFDENYDRSVFFTFAGDQNLSVAIPVVGGAWCIVDSAGTALDNCEVDDDLQFQLMNLLSLMGASVRVPGHILGISSPFRTSNLYKYYDLLIRESV